MAETSIREAIGIDLKLPSFCNSIFSRTSSANVSGTVICLPFITPASSLIWSDIFFILSIKKTTCKAKACGQYKNLFPDVVDSFLSGAVLLVTGLALIIELHHFLEDDSKPLLLLLIADSLKIHEIVCCVSPE